MKIKVDQVKESTLELKEQYDPLGLDLNRPDVKFTEPIYVSAEITKGINNIRAKIKIETAMHLDCSRCLEVFETALSKEFELNFPIDNQKIIDITDSLRAEIILSYPLTPLCSSDCLGLCPKCGQNLNKGKCSCQK